MYAMSSVLLTGAAFVSCVIAQSCPIQFDGRIAQDTTLATLDTTASPFNPNYVKGKTDDEDLTWSSIAKFPATPPSLFDIKSKAIEVTLNDSSIFAPSATNVQLGFRRAELLPASNNGSDPSTVGVKTLHFSLLKDTSRPLNLSHEYQIVFLESADYSTNQIALKTGQIIGTNTTADRDMLQLFGNVNAVPLQTLFKTKFTPGTWHNFGVILDFNKLTTQVLYSKDCEPLKKVTGAISNDVSGRGEFHFGLLKKPTGEGLTDITKQGYQESDIHEGVIFGGIFEEDSSAGCISLGGGR